MPHLASLPTFCVSSMAVLANKSLTTELCYNFLSREGCNIYVSRVRPKMWVGRTSPICSGKTAVCGMDAAVS